MAEGQPRVTAIFISPDKGIPMQAQTKVHAIAGKGLEGNRYARGTGAYSRSKREVIRHISLVSQEAIDAANAENGTTFTPAETRRNIVTQGIDLNGLVNQEFSVGGVRMRGVELCDPCARPSALSHKSGFEPAFRQRGGLRAEILSNGDIAVEDPIQVIS